MFSMSPCVLTALLAAAVLVVLPLSSFASPELTEADFKRMKIKELRNFLEDRGLTCPGCQEKADFVRVAFTNRAKKPLSEEGKREIPKAPLWEVWRDNAKLVCEEAAKKRGLDVTAKPQSDICSAVALVVENFFMQHGKRVANKLRKNHEALLKTSYKNVYYDAGHVLLKRLTEYCLVSEENQNKCSSIGSLTTMLESGKMVDFAKWMTNVGIENTNPMYEVLDGRGDL
ncbi:hypothetical protein, conserved [Trypanosoma brucei gambiense DAL972]|uniref:ARMET C-terminal domain-containing protein n=2 Tax=Trypanosoma brucei TaxID=5691 RepID=C9ZNP7_TRYB9|nr:hypothetical protein, conserved [Trypanosoma brucei gambiense DAL972]RHW72304.1 Degradation arginine-rich protein for mis-folding [Trypanosoma brucei equiperdum]CBH11025.1 hypothetical protein, conserved [Trypanosoma brucei gambiense DAL972]|eukprot:XP_011773312.1 hypothetical protein, conserved [Trypanosoma brucei gambiense DAL972]